MRIMDDDPDVKIQVEGHRCMYIHMYVHTQYRIQSVHIHGNTLSNTHTQTHIHTHTHTHTHTHITAVTETNRQGLHCSEHKRSTNSKKTNAL